MHVKQEDLAPPPNIILLKAGISQGWRRMFAGLGVRERMRRDSAIEDKHTLEAKCLGRDATKYRQTPDSGTPVFTSLDYRHPDSPKGSQRQGLPDVSLRGLYQELAQNGYHPSDVHWFRTEKQRNRPADMVTLCLEFTLQAEPTYQNLQLVHDTLIDLFEDCAWGFVYVWANSQKPDGRVPHTVNVVHRESKTPGHFRLMFDRGFWNVTHV